MLQGLFAVGGFDLVGRGFLANPQHLVRIYFSGRLARHVFIMRHDFIDVE